MWIKDAAVIFPTSLPNELFIREGEAPAEPYRRKLGRSLALPNALRDIAFQRCLEW